MNSIRCNLLLAILAGDVACCAVATAAPAPNPLSVLEARCLKCHGGEKVRGGLDISTRALLMQGGDNGAAVVPGHSADSLLYRQIAHLEKPGMPAKQEALPQEEIDVLAKWIDAGAVYERPLDKNASVVNATTRPGGEMVVSDEDRKFWSFAPLRVVAPPEVKNEGWGRNAVDRFILKALEDRKLSPAAEASRQKLVRRVYFDLIGLPPTPEEMDGALRDAAGDWYEKLVDRLLENPHFGERWGRHWLDVARYAESDGYETDADRPGMFHYRDFVIRAFNEDMPFDRFLQWQIAGDVLSPENPQALAATGFCTTGPVSISADGTPLEKEQYRYDELDDIVSTTGSAMLGLTVACARCHDHKYDPIPTRDYYRLAAAFTNTKRVGAAFKFDNGKTAEELRKAAEQPLMLADEKANRVKSFLLRRGDPTSKAEEVQPGFLSVLQRGGGVGSEAPRKMLAESITDVEHGAGQLVARVIVNRLWQHHFGEGLVRTPGDFGAQGSRPTHPELLDWLANELIRGGWKLKPIHRLMLLSAAYRQDTTFDAAKAKIDPANELLWRRRPMRLEAEIIRDAMLATSGQLKAEIYGPSIKPAIPPEANVGRNKDLMPRPKEDGPDQWRRSVYLFVKRSLLTPLLDVMDAPTANASCARRNQATVPTQALMLMNDPFVRRQAKFFAERCVKEAGEDPTARVRWAYRLALGREPTEGEVQAAAKFMSANPGKEPFTNFCHVLLQLNEFVYID